MACATLADRRVRPAPHQQDRAASRTCRPRRMRSHGTISMGERSALSAVSALASLLGVSHRVVSSLQTEGEALITSDRRRVLRGHYLRVVTRRVRIRRSAQRGARSGGRRGMAGPRRPDPVRARSIHLREERAPPVEAERLLPLALSEAGGRDGRHRRRRAHRSGQSTTIASSARSDSDRASSRRSSAPRRWSSGSTSAISVSSTCETCRRRRRTTPSGAGARAEAASPRSSSPSRARASPHDKYYFRHRDRMIAGAVTPARMDLGNQELVEAHLHSVWLMETGLNLGHSIEETIDRDLRGYPIEPGIAKALTLSATKRAEVIHVLWGDRAARARDQTSRVVHGGVDRRAGRRRGGGVRSGVRSLARALPVGGGAARCRAARAGQEAGDEGREADRRAARARSEARDRSLA